MVSSSARVLLMAMDKRGNCIITLCFSHFYSEGYFGQVWAPFLLLGDKHESEGVERYH